VGEHRAETDGVPNAVPMKGFTKESPRRTILWFDLVLTDFYAEWKGKLIVRWPPLDKNWHRWAHKPKNEMPATGLIYKRRLGFRVQPRRGKG
jgi:hypothetical protein